jgi:hypothetical protein
MKIWWKADSCVSDGSGSPQRSEDYSGQRGGGAVQRSWRHAPIINC